MRVVLLTYHFLPRIGGVELATHSLALALWKAGVELTIVAPQRTPHLPVPYRIVPLRRIRGLPRWGAAWWTLWQLWRRERFQVLHAQMLYPAGADAAAFARWIGVPLVLSAQGADILTYEPLRYGLRLKRSNARRIARALRRAGALTYHSVEMARELAREAAPHTPMLLFLPNGTWTERFRGYDRQQLRRDYGLQPTELVFITVARNSPIKGIDILLQAARRLAERIPHGWRLWVMGRGIERLRTELPDVPVELLGEMPTESTPEGMPLHPPTEMVRRLLAADVFVAPALSGGFELACAEAAAAGLPIILGRTNGASDMVRLYGAGVVVPPADPEALAQAMAHMYECPERRLQQRQCALKMAQVLDWNVLARRCCRIYQRLVERAGRQR